MMIAEVGFIENVSGSRMATPFAPPRPGKTPISTPSRMPTSIRKKFCSVRTTPNPCIRALISSTASPLFPCLRGLVAQHVLERALGQRHLEPDFEHQEQRDRHANA